MKQLKRLSIIAGVLGILVGGSGSPTQLLAARSTDAQASCDVAPLAEDEFLALIGSPVGEPLSPAVLATALPSGTPADVATRLEIESAIRLLIRCGNEGDTARIVALYSRRLLRERSAVLLPLLQGNATPVSGAAGQLVLISVTDVVQMSDGRVSSIVWLRRAPLDAHNDVLVMVFVKERGGWLLDEAFDEVQRGDELVPVEELIPSATPTT